MNDHRWVRRIESTGRHPATPWHLVGKYQTYPRLRVAIRCSGHELADPQSLTLRAEIPPLEIHRLEYCNRCWRLKER